MKQLGCDWDMNWKRDKLYLHNISKVDYTVQVQAFVSMESFVFRAKFRSWSPASQANLLQQQQDSGALPICDWMIQSQSHTYKTSPASRVRHFSKAFMATVFLLLCWSNQGTCLVIKQAVAVATVDGVWSELQSLLEISKLDHSELALFAS